MLTGEELERAHAEGKQLYLPHFATCPNVWRHRKKGNRRRHGNSDESLRLDDLRDNVAGAGRVLLLSPSRSALAYFEVDLVVEQARKILAPASHQSFRR
jgi:hypothetical protein